MARPTAHGHSSRIASFTSRSGVHVIDETISVTAWLALQLLERGVRDRPRDGVVLLAGDISSGPPSGFSIACRSQPSGESIGYSIQSPRSSRSTASSAIPTPNSAGRSAYRTRRSMSPAPQGARRVRQAFRGRSSPRQGGPSSLLDGSPSAAISFRARTAASH
jgi:hypothetical protein